MNQKFIELILENEEVEKMLDKILNLFRKKSIEPNVQLSVSEMDKLDDGIISYDTPNPVSPFKKGSSV